MILAPQKAGPEGVQAKARLGNFGRSCLKIIVKRRLGVVLVTSCCWDKIQWKQHKERRSGLSWLTVKITVHRSREVTAAEA